MNSVETIEKSAIDLDIGSNLVYPLKEIKIDPVRLEGDLCRMYEHFWIPQNRYKSDITHWDGISIYSISGDAQDLRCADRLPVKKTPAGDKCLYISNELLPQFHAPWLRVVFYRLRAGTQIPRHRDLGENRAIPGIIRIHIPVVTNDKVKMYVDGTAYYFPLGTAWYFDPTAYHSVENNGGEDRIHLVFDLMLSPALEKMLKPLTMNDRIRFSHIVLLSYLNIGKAFIRFVQTREGRARIRARAAQVFHLAARR